MVGFCVTGGKKAPTTVPLEVPENVAGVARGLGLFLKWAKFSKNGHHLASCQNTVFNKFVTSRVRNTSPARVGRRGRVLRCRGGQGGARLRAGERLRDRCGGFGGAPSPPRVGHVFLNGHHLVSCQKKVFNKCVPSGGHVSGSSRPLGLGIVLQRGQGDARLHARGRSGDRCGGSGWGLRVLLERGAFSTNKHNFVSCQNKVLISL